jgi:hypothetical protein
VVSLASLLPAELDAAGELIPADARQRLTAASVLGLPALSGLLLECPLGARPGPVGLALYAAGKRDRAVLTELAAGAADSAAWSAVASVLLSPNCSAADLWLEFDLTDDPFVAGPEPPSVFVAVDRSLGRPPRLGPAAESAQRHAAAALAAVLGLLGPSEPDPRPWLARVLALLPASARLSYLGAMHGRGERGWRLTFDSMPLDGSCTAMLSRLGLPDWQAYVPLIDRLAAVVPAAVLHLDIEPDGGPGPRLGFELPAEAVAAPELSDYVTPTQRAALGQWPSQRHRLVDPASWPAALTGADHLRRSVNHLKVDCPGAAEPPRLKAYLAVGWGRQLPGPQLW